MHNAFAGLFRLDYDEKLFKRNYRNPVLVGGGGDNTVVREYATIKPGVLYQGYGMQRRAYGEQVVRAGCVLAAITGNVGVPGGWASGLGLQAPHGGPQWTVFPLGENPVEAAIPVFLWTDLNARKSRGIVWTC